MSFDIIPASFRAEIVAALRGRTNAESPGMAEFVAKLDGGDFSSDKIDIVSGRFSGSDEDSVLFLAASNEHSDSVFLSHISARSVSPEEADEIIANDEAYVSSESLTEFLDRALDCVV